mgnify:CR=1 FL=1
MIIEISIKAYLKDYLVHLHGGQHPIPLTKRTALGKMVYQYSEKVPPDCMYRPGDISDRRKLILEVGFLGNNNELRKDPDYYFYIPRDKQRIIEDIFDTVFKELFHEYIDQNREDFEKRIKDSIEKFCDDRDIAFDNITYEALKKSYYRYRKKQSQEIIKS